MPQSHALKENTSTTRSMWKPLNARLSLLHLLETCSVVQMDGLKHDLKGHVKPTEPTIAKKYMDSMHLGIDSELHTLLMHRVCDCDKGMKPRWLGLSLSVVYRSKGNCGRRWEAHTFPTIFKRQQFLYLVLKSQAVSSMEPDIRNCFSTSSLTSSITPTLSDITYPREEGPSGCHTTHLEHQYGINKKPSTLWLIPQQWRRVQNKFLQVFLIQFLSLR